MVSYQQNILARAIIETEENTANLKLFVNIPVRNLEASKAFFAQLGFGFNSQFTDDNAAALVLSEDNYVMLLKEDFFKNFTKKPIADAHGSAGAIYSITVESREKVDELVNKAMVAGAKATIEPMDEGWMYNRSFEDLDGHLWEVFYMDPAHIQ